MKNVFLRRIVLLAGLSVVFTFAMQAKEKINGGKNVVTNVLMLGLNNNVSSNYFPMSTITEETGITKDVIDQEYNTIIMDNIIASAKASCKFIPATMEEGSDLIRINGEGDESYSDLSSIPNDEYKKLLDTAGAEYLLVLNQHYLKWQETPMRTLFHVVSYTLYDKNKNEVYRNNSHFTSMNLERPDKLRKISNKTSGRIATTVAGQISKLKK